MTLSPRSFICVGTYEKGMIGLELTRNPTTNPQTEDDTLLYLSAPFSPQPHLGSVDTIAMCGSILATGCTDELIRLYDLGRMKEIGKCNEHSASLSAIALIERNQDKAMVSCDKSGVLYFWTSKKNGQEWNCQKGLELGHSYINELSVHPSAKMAIGLSSIDHCYHLINLQRGNIAQKVSVKRKEPLRHCLWADDGFTYILTCGKHFLLYDLRQQSDTGKEQPLIEGDLSFDVISLLFLDARTFVCGGEKGVWGIVCVKDGEGETPPSFSYHPLKTLSDRYFIQSVPHS
ncbi:hypothetical protein BLNAU_3584 [Blattamonas nauphoetae]|uniref:Uncharacterized protein n=1 Tax=Blattamonas nauphoetae TaxID=2049346 RepID=A0ABQ9YCQ1_9EUKA|nr:hypothetical protein BLNAU_3584 [Blattamonas nauphoetae]